MTRRITNEAYLFTPLYEPAKGTPSSPSVDTLTIYRDSGELQLNGKKKREKSSLCCIFFLIVSISSTSSPEFSHSKAICSLWHFWFH